MAKTVFRPGEAKNIEDKVMLPLFKNYAPVEEEKEEEVVEEYTGPTAEDLRKEAEKIGIQCSDSDTWEDVFFRIMLNKVEDNLGDGVPCILYEYPTQLGALARQKPTDSKVCERFEVYACGVELCNAFSELTDPVEQRSRFIANYSERKRLYGWDDPMDTDFLNALDYGMPEASGNALGVDRLIMLISKAKTLKDTVWVPVK